MSITLANIKTAYDALGTLAAVTKAALATQQALLPRPTFPVDVTADADYNTPLAAQVTFDAAWNTATNAYLVALAAQRVQEAVVTALMPANQWVRLTTLSNWGAVTTQYISFPIVATTSPNGCALYTMNAVTVLPVQAYPSLT